MNNDDSSMVVRLLQDRLARMEHRVSRLERRLCMPAPETKCRRCGEPGADFQPDYIKGFDFWYCDDKCVEAALAASERAWKEGTGPEPYGAREFNF